MEKIKILADSTCDLNNDIIKKYNIDLVPIYINLGQKSYLDGIDIFKGDIFNYYNKTKNIATTSAPTPAYYEEIYKKLTKDGYSVIHFSISSKFTSSYNNQKIASEKFSNVYPIDSRSISSGMGILAVYASRLREKNLSVKEIIEKCEKIKNNIEGSFILDTLTFMHKGGRCTGVQAMGANLLGLKPSIELKNGALIVGKKYRGKLNKILLEHCENQLKEKNNIDKNVLMIAHSGVDDYILNNTVKKLYELQKFKEIIINDTRCSVAVHCGPNTLGIFYVTI